MNNTPTLMDSEEKRAPWNTRKTKKITVDVSQCLSAAVDIEVPEDLEYDYINLEDYVREQIVLPSEVALEHCPNCWYVDDFCVSI